MDKCDVKGLAMGIGTMWGLYVLSAGWLAPFGWWTAFVTGLGSTGYIGYAPGFVGGIIGGIWGFIDGAVAGIIIAYVYNWTVSHKKHR